MLLRFFQVLIGIAIALSQFDASAQALRSYETESDTALLEYMSRRGDVDAQMRLAHMLSFGIGTEKDEAKAVYWYRMAATAGSLKARKELLGMLRYGYGTPKDPRQIYAWLQKSSEEGDLRATAEMEQMVLRGFDPRTASIDPSTPYRESSKEKQPSRAKTSPPPAAGNNLLDPTPTPLPQRASCPSTARLVANATGYNGSFLVELRAGNRPGSKRISGGTTRNGQDLSFSNVCPGKYFFAFGPDDEESISVTRYFEVSVEGTSYTNPVVTIFYSRLRSEGQRVQVTRKKDL